MLLRHEDAHNHVDQIKHIKAMCSPLKVVVKGIMCSEDAVEAIQQGADAIWVSNGGSTKTDYVPSAISAL